MSKKYALYVGRWQNWHKGHEWLIKQQMDQGKNVWVAIRDVQVDENNPKTAQEVFQMLIQEPFFNDNFDKILLSIIPDIESINYGRGVGYDVIYHEPPTERFIDIDTTNTNETESYYELIEKLKQNI